MWTLSLHIKANLTNIDYVPRKYVLNSVLFHLHIFPAMDLFLFLLIFIFLNLSSSSSFLKTCKFKSNLGKIKKNMGAVVKHWMASKF
jgi:hypothetical protein